MGVDPGKAQQIDQIITKNVEVLDKNDPAKKIGFYFDEWGSWYDLEPGSNPGFLVQRNTLRDALLAALHFNVFHAHAERVKMTNIAQMVNVLQAMILTTKDKMVLTPTYHAFAMYIPFQDATFAARHARRQPGLRSTSTRCPPSAPPQRVAGRQALPRPRQRPRP